MGYLFYFLMLIAICVVNCATNQKPSLIQKTMDIKKYMNLSVDPCEDFYEYACGNYRKQFGKIKPQSVFRQMENKINYDVIKLLEQPIKKNEQRMHHIAKDFFRACTDVTQINRLGYEPIKRFLEENGGMPALKPSWDESRFSWMEAVSSFKRQYGMDILIGLEIKEHFERKNEYAMYLGPPKILHKNRVRKTRVQEKKEIVNQLKKLGIQQNLADRTSNDLLHFERELMSFQGNSEQYQEIKLYDFNGKHETIDFNSYIMSSLDHPVNSFNLLIQNGSYFENLEKIIAVTPKRKLANYIMWTAIRHLNLTDDNEQHRYTLECLKLTKQYFANVLGDMYNEHLKFDQNTVTNDILEIVNGLKNSFQDISFQWMENDSTKKVASYKLMNMKIDFNKYFDPQNEYPTLNHTSITQGQFIRNILTMMGIQWEIEKSQLFSSMGRRRGGMVYANSDIDDVQSYSVQPGYSLKTNEIKIPKGVLNYPIYNYDFPKSIKYGQIGAIIGRQIAKGFSTVTYKRLVEIWNTITIPLFNERVQCFVEQYKNYKFADGFLPENQNQVENIADNSAVRVAFQTYLKWLADPEITDAVASETLQRLDFSNTQLFFISFAQTWCSNLSDDGQVMPEDSMDYIPEKFRVNGPLSNFDEFSTEFNCSPGSGMNSPDKCVIY